MKLSYEDKVKIYEMRKSGVTWSQIHDQFGVNTNNLRYMFRLIERHGIISYYLMKAILFNLLFF